MIMSINLAITLISTWLHVASTLPVLYNENVTTPVVTVTTVQQEWTARDFPDPQKDLERCGRRGKRSWVCDPNGVISYEEADKLDSIINDVRSKAKCACGSCPSDGRGRYAIAVAFVNKLNLEGAEPTDNNKQRAIENFALFLRTLYWNYGYCQDGVVIVVSREDRKVWTSTGVTPRKRLVNGCVDLVYNKVKGKFTDGRFYDGAKEMLEYYANVLLGGSCGTKSGLSIGAIIGIVIGAISGVLFIISLILICVGMKFNWECVTGTCLGICMGCILGAIQSCINAIIVSVFQAICEALGCDECCEPIECDCLGDEGYTSNDGGGGGGGGF
ncbi:unnamed protein product [Owenia fusiformis]|uniref:Uncharacterized protein n=1 Tax=Owenia fusiformis TaxID=6347 RepID=A0A8J1XGX2_OWEFU|nr:unnamed protein product [Owenia fusiformis]